MATKVDFYNTVYLLALYDLAKPKCASNPASLPDLVSNLQNQAGSHEVPRRDIIEHTVKTIIDPSHPDLHVSDSAPYGSRAAHQTAFAASHCSSNSSFELSNTSVTDGAGYHRLTPQGICELASFAQDGFVQQPDWEPLFSPHAKDLLKEIAEQYGHIADVYEATKLRQILP